MFGSSSSAPPPAPPPPPPPTPPTFASSSVQNAGANYASKQTGGIASTILTDSTTPTGGSKSKTLLGG